MHRRHLLATALSAFSSSMFPHRAFASARPSGARVRPGEPGWPDASAWDALRLRVDGHLRQPASPLSACGDASTGEACATLFHDLKNPYFIADDPALTQTCGWVDAWTSRPSAYVVEARSAAHVAAAVDFAREHDLRLVVRGGGHSYLGHSCAPDSLMIWTRAMDAVTLHDAFVPLGRDGVDEPVPAVSVGAGAVWMRVYQAVMTEAGRYVQGGGCATVGTAGLVQGGGFGTYSKRFGLASASLLEADVVTANGVIRTVNPSREPDLFWALKGGGGGTFGVVTRLTLRTWDLPAWFGVVMTTITAGSDDSFRRLVGAFVGFYADALATDHWGELVRVEPGRRLVISMNFQGMDKATAAALWAPFLSEIAQWADVNASPPVIVAGPGRGRWDPAFLDAHAPGVVAHDDRPGAPVGNVFWQSNRAEAGHVIHGFESVWLPAALLAPTTRPALVDALVAAASQWTVELHFQKGLSGARPEVVAAARDTPVNSTVCDAFALAIVASEGPPAFPDIPGHTPRTAAARHDAERIERATRALRTVAPSSGSYQAESNYFQTDWRTAYWGPHFERLSAIKRRYDPEGLFFVRHGVGSEDWSDDGFERVRPG